MKNNVKRQWIIFAIVSAIIIVIIAYMIIMVVKVVSDTEQSAREDFSSKAESSEETTAETGLTAKDDTAYTLKSLSFTIPKGWTYAEHKNEDWFEMESPNHYTVHISYSHDGVEKAQSDMRLMKSQLETVATVIGTDEFKSCSVGNMKGYRFVYTATFRDYTTTHINHIVEDSSYTYELNSYFALMNSELSEGREAAKDGDYYEQTIMKNMKFQ